MVLVFASAVMMGQLSGKPIQLTGAFGQDLKPTTFLLRSAKATVFFFISTDCPIANRYAPEMKRIAATYQKRGVNFYRVYVLDKSKVKETVRHGRDFGLKFPLLLDPNRKLVQATGVTVTPEVSVISSSGIQIYRGRIDDQNVEHGTIRKNYRRDLRLALDEHLAGKPVSMPVTSAIGCFL